MKPDFLVRFAKISKTEFDRLLRIQENALIESQIEKNKIYEFIRN